VESAPAPAPGSAVREGVRLADLTTFRIGGPARALLEPATPEAAAAAVRQARERGAGLRILGGGSNLLVADEGVDDLVLATSRMRRCIRDGDRFHVWAGTSLPGLVREAHRAGLSGLEGLPGIPAQLGGAIRMNAGGRWGEIFDVVESVTVCDLATGETARRTRAECRPAYRDSRLGAVLVLEATLRLAPGDPKEVYARTKEHLEEKNRIQPVAEASAGCIFRNPAPLRAGSLIDECGLKGARVGAIEVSRKHANYLVNLGGGTCRDALALVELVRERVRRERGVVLETEVEIW
jgi:UDP-N-acetylmuramate dehydrogenase